MKNLQDEGLKPIELPPLPDSPLVSVLIASYNYTRYIGEAIESSLNQTYSHFEVIVCDDGSTDNSCEVVEAYAQRDSRLKLLRKQNGGVASALNAAYRESSGKIICLLDADDIWMLNKLQRVVDAFKSYPEGGFVIHNVIQIDRHGKFIKPTPMLRKLASGWMAPFALANGGFVDDLPPTSALCIRREVADFIFPINEFFLRNVDTVVTNLAAFITVIVPVPEVLNMYRLHGANLTGTLSLTADFLERELNVSKHIHQELGQFLKKIYGAEVAEKLTGLEFRLTYCHNRYLLTRLKDAPKAESREAHRSLVAHPQFNWSGPERWLLQWGEYLPDPLFAALFHQVYGASQLKRIVRLIRRGGVGVHCASE